MLALESMRPWKLERVPDGSTILLAASLPEPPYPPEILALREKLRAMVKEDQVGVISGAKSGSRRQRPNGRVCDPAGTRR